jgi:hypothetical protein
MALVISNRLSRQGRKFGLTIGSAFIVLSGLARWRGRDEVTEACFVVGGMFLLGALIAPRYLCPVERAWMRLSWFISRVTSPVFVGIMYFIVITPMGILMRKLGLSQVSSSEDRDTLWVARDDSCRSDLRRQF